MPVFFTINNATTPTKIDVRPCTRQYDDSIVLSDQEDQEMSPSNSPHRAIRANSPSLDDIQRFIPFPITPVKEEDADRMIDDGRVYNLPFNFVQRGLLFIYLQLRLQNFDEKDLEHEQLTDLADFVEVSTMKFVPDAEDVMTFFPFPASVFNLIQGVAPITEDEVNTLNSAAEVDDLKKFIANIQNGLHYVSFFHTLKRWF